MDYVILPEKHCWNCKFKTFRYGALFCNYHEKRVVGDACDAWKKKVVEKQN